MSQSEKKGTRINKYLSEIGYCSRREADKLIEQRRVKINGKFPVKATPVKSGDTISVDGIILENVNTDTVFLAFNKPVGIVCTTDPKEKDNITDYINYPRRIFPIGRLDKPSEGLIFLTSDGDMVNKILRAGNKHEKEYVVTVNKPITKEFIQGMSSGVPIMGQTTKKCRVEKISPMQFKIVLVQGLNRQIRRMCEYFEYEVKKLKRTRIMHIKLDVPAGQWRDFTNEEMQIMNQQLAGSSKTQKSSSPKKNTPPKARKSKPKTTTNKKYAASKGRGRSQSRTKTAKRKKHK